MTSGSRASGLDTPPLYDSTDSLLRFAMRADATLSGLSGLAIAFFADRLSSLTGLSPGVEYTAGAAFVVYGLAVFGLAALPNPRRAGIGVALANGAYTVAAVLAADVVSMTTAGEVAMLATGAYTAAFAVLQYLGVRRLAR